MSTLPHELFTFCIGRGMPEPLPTADQVEWLQRLIYRLEADNAKLRALIGKIRTFSCSVDNAYSKTVARLIELDGSTTRTTEPTDG